MSPLLLSLLFFFNDTATTEIYTLSLHDALPISALEITPPTRCSGFFINTQITHQYFDILLGQDRKSTRLNSSHTVISYAVFCLKKKKKVRAYSPRFCNRHVPIGYKYATSVTIAT